MTQISKKYTILFHKYDTFHNLLNAKLIYSPILLQELSKFHYMTISENNDGGVGDMDFPWFFFFFFLPTGFSFMTIHESQDCRGKGREFL